MVEMRDSRAAAPGDGLSRRRFLGLGAAAAAASLLPVDVFAAPAAAERCLSFFNTHTGERLRTTYCYAGQYVGGALKEIDFILRDFRANEVKPIDPKLLDLLHLLNARVEASEPFHIISGYRSPHTNTMLRARGGASSGVASGSLHQVGRAIDIRLPGVKLAHLRDAARSLKLGGVGFYPSSDFVHVDTGRVRYW